MEKWKSGRTQVNWNFSPIRVDQNALSQHALPLLTERWLSSEISVRFRFGLVLCNLDGYILPPLMFRYGRFGLRAKDGLDREGLGVVTRFPPGL